MQEPTVGELIENQREIKREAQKAERVGDTKRVAELAIQFANLGAKIHALQTGTDSHSRVVPILRSACKLPRIRDYLVADLRKRSPYQFDAQGKVVSAIDERGQWNPVFTREAVLHWQTTRDARAGVALDTRKGPSRPYCTLGIARDRFGYLDRFMVRLSDHNVTNRHDDEEQMGRSTRLLSLDPAEIDVVMAMIEIVTPKGMQ